MSYIKLDRGIVDWEWFTDGDMLKLWIYLLEMAQYTNREYKGISLKRGQIIVGRKKLAERLEMSESQIRRCLKRLEKSQQITIKTTNKYSLITIIKYGFYQDGVVESDQQNDQQTTNKRPTNDHITRKKRKKEGKEDILPVYDSSLNIPMSKEQEDELLELMKGEA